MTIELSLRRRATRARLFAFLWLSVAVVILIGTYISLPSVAGRTLDSVNKIEGNITGASSISPKDGASTEKTSFLSLRMFALTTLVLGVVAVSFACYLLGKGALMEMESAERLRGIADALCIAGNDIGQLEKAAALLLPKAQYLPDSKSISVADLKDFTEVLKKIR